VVLLPLLGALLLLPSFRGARLFAGMLFAWIAIVAGVALAWGVGYAARFSNETYIPTSIAFYANVAALALATSWWVADRWGRAVDEARIARKQAEEGERRYRMLFEESPDGILVSTNDFRIVDANPAFCAMAGYSIEELRSISYEELMEPGEIPSARQARDRLRAHGEVRVAEWKMRAKDGSRLIVELSARPRLDDTVQVSFRDLTARRTAEAEARRLTAAVEQVGDLILILDTDDIVLYLNPAFARITGYTAAEAVGRTATSLLRSGKHTQSFYDDLDAAHRENRPWSGRIINRRRDGTTFTEDLHMWPLRDQDGRAIGSVEVGRDMTHELVLESQLRQAAKMEAIGHLAGGVAHDFNNMLTAIRGYADLVRRGLPEDLAGDREDLDVVIQTADRATALTGQLLAFARRSVLEPQILDPAVAVSEIAPMLRRLLGEHIELDVRTSPRSSRIKVDPGQLTQVVLNLAVNGGDAMPGGGRLVIRTAEVDFDEAAAVAHPEGRPGSFVVLSVSDDGVGMTEEVQKRLFEPFFTTKEPGKGTGMGLATVFGIVRMSDGWIEVRSRVGHGTTFELYFPRLVGGDAAATSPDLADIVPAGPETILFVEDEPAVRAFGRRCLMGLGYTVLEASGASDALALAGAHPGSVDLLLTDVRMPGLQGPQLAERVRELRPGIRVLYCSGLGEGTADLGDAGGKGFLQKPYTRESLARAVRDSLDRSEPAD
jgi:PAS domain S-box-containing protein